MEFSKVVQTMSEQTGGEIDSATIWEAFNAEFIRSKSPLEFIKHVTQVDDSSEDKRDLTADVIFQGKEIQIHGQGNGPIDAFVQGLKQQFAVDFRVVDYHQHATGTGADAQSACYVEIQVEDTSTRYGAALHSNIVCASLEAVCSAFNRAVLSGALEPQ